MKEVYLAYISRLKGMNRGRNKGFSQSFQRCLCSQVLNLLVKRYGSFVDSLSEAQRQSSYPLNALFMKCMLHGRCSYAVVDHRSRSGMQSRFAAVHRWKLISLVVRVTPSLNNEISASHGSPLPVGPFEI